MLSQRPAIQLCARGKRDGSKCQYGSLEISRRSERGRTAYLPKDVIGSRATAQDNRAGSAYRQRGRNLDDVDAAAM